MRSLTVLLILLFFIPAPSFAENLKVGVEKNNPPFVIHDENNQLTGFDVEIAKAICNVLEKKCVFVVKEWNELIQGLLDLEYDVILSSLSITKEREEEIIFSHRYYKHGAKFIAKKGLHKKASVKKIGNKRVGILKGSAAERYLLDKMGETSSLFRFESLEKAIDALKMDQLDLVFGDRLKLNQQLKNQSALQFTGYSYTHSDYFRAVGIALRPEDKSLKDQINQSLKKLRDNKVYHAINKRYFPFSIYGR